MAACPSTMRALRPSRVLLALCSVLAIGLTALAGSWSIASAADAPSRSTPCVSSRHGGAVMSMPGACLESEPVSDIAWVDSFGEESDPDPDSDHTHRHPAAPACITRTSHVTDEPRVVRVTPVGFRPLRI